MRADAPQLLVLDKEGGRLYWCDREGMRVIPDDTGDATRRCVGIALDKAKAGMSTRHKKDRRMPESAASSGLPSSYPPGATADRRPDIERLLADLPEPVDLDIDHHDAMLYWTDRGDDTHDGNTLNRARITASGLVDREVLARDLPVGIGVSPDSRGRRAFVTDRGGNERELNIDTKHESHFTTVALSVC